MKTVISVPDPIYQAAEHLARRLKMSRSQLYTEAVRRFLVEHRGRGVTELLNQVYAKEPSESGLDPLLAELQRRAMPGPRQA